MAIERSPGDRKSSPFIVFGNDKARVTFDITASHHINADCDVITNLETCVVNEIDFLFSTYW